MRTGKITYRDPDLRVPSFGGVSPEAAAARIVNHFFSSAGAETVNTGKSDHWESFYYNHKGEQAPSPFAQHFADGLRGAERLLEIGCGNGRDASFFRSRGLEVVAIDASSAAIESCRKQHGADGIRLMVGKLGSPDLDVGDSSICSIHDSCSTP